MADYIAALCMEGGIDGVDGWMHGWQSTDGWVHGWHVCVCESTDGCVPVRHVWVLVAGKAWMGGCVNSM